MSVAFISHSDCGRHDTGWNHPEHVGRLRGITRALREHPELFGTLEHIEGRHATVEEIALAHDAGYIERVLKMAAEGGGQLDDDTLMSEGSGDAALAGAGCVLDAVDRAFDGRSLRSFCAVRPPGHHALRASAMGFCIFGNVAIAARYARRKHGAERILIVDWDVHHGNGTQALIEHDRSIHFVSMHQWPWYPGTGAADDRGRGNVWNVPMPAGLPPEQYVNALQQAVDSATLEATPDVVLISAGFDCLRGDPLGGFTLEIDDIRLLTKWLVQAAESWCGGRLISVLEGGYEPARVGEASVAHMASM
ncbi:MAG: histone deacetylase [Gemmatimonadaceae bacterium]